MTQTILHFWEKWNVCTYIHIFDSHVTANPVFTVAFLEWTDRHLQKDREASQKSNVLVMDHPSSRPRTTYLPLLAFAIPLLDEFWRKYKSIYFLRGRSTRYLWTQHTHTYTVSGGTIVSARCKQTMTCHFLQLFK